MEKLRTSCGTLAVGVLPSVCAASDYGGIVQGLAAFAVGGTLAAIALLAGVGAALRRAPRWLSRAALYWVIASLVAVGVILSVRAVLDRQSIRWDGDFPLFLGSVLVPGAVAAAAVWLMFTRLRR